MPDNEQQQQQQSTAPPVGGDTAPEVEELRQRAEQAERELALRRGLAGVDWFDPDDAYRELSRHAERDAEGKWVIVSPEPLPNGRGTETARGEHARLTPPEAARELAQRKPHWVRARVFGGSGAGSGTGASPAAGVTYAELLRPENAGKLREFVHERPQELQRLRQAHFEK